MHEKVFALLLEVGLVCFRGGQLVVPAVEPLQCRAASEGLEVARQLVALELETRQRRAASERLEAARDLVLRQGEALQRHAQPWSGSRLPVRWLDSR